MARQARRSNQSGNNAAVAADEPLIAIRAHDDKMKLIKQVVPRSAGPTIMRMAMQWGYILRVRTRWAGDTDMREYFGARAIEDLAKLGIKLPKIQEFALVKHIEIELLKWEPVKADAAAEAKAAGIVNAAAEIPWEYLFSAATRNVGRFQSLLITRCFSNKSKVKPTAPRRVLFVESAPGRIDEKYGFDDEETRISAAMNVVEDKGLVFARTEPYSKLKAMVEAKDWQAIHVTGVDTHQAAWLIPDFYDAVAKVARREEVIDKNDRLLDGMIIRGDTDSELPVRYDELADLLLASKRPKDRDAPYPYVITLNLYYSGARTARELVRRGAYAALGFLDEIDDEFAERFFQAFYWAWCHDKKLIPEAFLEAWSEMDSDRMHGTAIVIWLGRSMVSETSTPRKSIARKSATKRRTGTR
jgi:hypothetical protein